MVRRRSRVRFPFGALVAARAAPLRRGSSAGQSARLIIVRSRGRAPPPLPSVSKTRSRIDHLSTSEGPPWQASPRTFARRSRWPAQRARSVTTSPRRTVVTRRIVWNCRSTARAAVSPRHTARPADCSLKKYPEEFTPRGFFLPARTSATP